MLEKFETVTHNNLLKILSNNNKQLQASIYLNYCSHDKNGNRWSCPNEKHKQHLHLFFFLNPQVVICGYIWTVCYNRHLGLNLETVKMQSVLQMPRNLPASKPGER